MGEIHNQPFHLSFNVTLTVEFQGPRVTSEGGLFRVRESDERLRLGTLIERHLTDPHRGQNTQFPLADLFWQSVCSRLAGYEEVHSADGWEKLPLAEIGRQQEQEGRVPSGRRLRQARDPPSPGRSRREVGYPDSRQLQPTIWRACGGGWCCRCGSATSR